jgi:plastocyanin
MELTMEKHVAHHKGFKVFGSRNSMLLLVLLAVFLPLFLLSLVQRQTITQHAAVIHQITIQNHSMNPTNLTINAGDTVTWTNQDVDGHDSHSTTEVWASPLLGQGQSYSFTFTQPGTYEYYCTPHKSTMNGYTITVLPAVDPPTATPIPASGEALQPADPTAVPEPTAVNTIAPPPIGATSLTVILGLDGIGQAGDSANPTSNSTSNKTPNQTAHLLALILVNSTGQTVAQTTGNVTYDQTTGDFRGSIDLGTAFTPGAYTVKVKLQKYLTKRIASNFTIAGGAINTLPSADLVVGDIDGNNMLDIQDYNALIACMDRELAQSTCQGKKRTEVDLNDDGAIGIEDTNLLLREFSARTGD